jgi:hypothetical protein
VAHVARKKKPLNDSDSDELDLKEDVEAAVIPSAKHEDPRKLPRLKI